MGKLPEKHSLQNTVSFLPILGKVELKYGTNLKEYQRFSRNIQFTSNDRLQTFKNLGC